MSNPATRVWSEELTQARRERNAAVADRRALEDVVIRINAMVELAKSKPAAFGAEDALEAIARLLPKGARCG